jgi:AAA15 family ATPase/GTPase
LRVRIQSAAIKHFRNVASGEIRFPCNLASDTFTMKSDVLGIYGQNGSGKTTFIDALEVLKCLLSGDPIKERLESCISKGHDVAELSFEFSIEDDQEHKFRAVYSAQVGLNCLNESVKASVLQDGAWTRMNTILECRSADTKAVIAPDTKKRELFGKNPQLLDELRITKMLCAKEHRSLLFSDEIFVLLQKGSGNTLWYHMLAALRHFAGASLFVINSRGAGLNPMGAELPVIYRMERSLGQLKLPLEQPAVIPAIEFSLARQVIGTINVVLHEIIPGMEIALAPLGNEFTEKGELGVRVQLVRTAVKAGSNDVIQLPLKYESEGIKKIISILHLFICAYNSPGITLAIDELDSGIYEYLLGELLQIMQKSGLGQLVFTSHNLRPLEMLNSSSIIFTTTNPENRYVRVSNVKPSNNLRLRYFRDITLGSDGEELYQETNSIEIAHAMRKIGIPSLDRVGGA